MQEIQILTANATLSRTPPPPPPAAGGVVPWGTKVGNGGCATASKAIVAAPATAPGLCRNPSEIQKK